MLNKRLIIPLFCLFLLPALQARTLEIDVHGMTCAFCADSLERKFKKMDAVSKVEISLKLKKIRLETKADAPDIETVKKAIIDAGFTPVKVKEIADAKKTS